MIVPWNGAASPEPMSRTAVDELNSPLSAVVLREGSSADFFAELYRTHFSYVWKSARRLGVRQEETDDVVQETFLTVHRLLDTYEPRGSLRSWVFSILYRIVLRYRRSRRRRSAITDETMNIDALPGSAAEAPDKGVETNENVRMLEEILERLDPDKRAVLVLAEVEEKPVAEIAEILGIKVNTAASRLRIAREHVDLSVARLRARDGWRLK